MSKLLLTDSVSLVLRLFLAGVLILAGTLKIAAGPLIFQQDIQGFGIFPQWMTIVAAYYVPWFELVLGAALILGVFTREAAILTGGLMLVFIGAMILVIVQGKNVDCGCFGGMFGEATIGPWTVLRNTGFVLASGILLWIGPGRFAFDRNEPTAAP